MCRSTIPDVFLFLALYDFPLGAVSKAIAAGSTFDVLIHWDKTDDENRHINIREKDMSLLTMFIEMRNRLRESKEPLVAGESMKWYLDVDCHLFLSPNGKPYTKIVLNHLNKIMLKDGVIPEGTKLTPYNYRRHFTTRLNYHEDARVAKHALRQAGHGGKKKDDASIFTNYYDLNQADNSRYIQAKINQELENENLELLAGESKAIENDRRRIKMDLIKINEEASDRQTEEFGDLLGPNNPVGSKVKKMFNKAAAEIDPKWKLQGDETFKTYKRRLLKIVLDESENGEVLRNLIVKMYQGNGVWSLRHSIDLKKKKKIDVSMCGHQGLNETLNYISQWEKNHPKVELSERIEMFSRFLSSNYKLLPQYNIYELADFKMKLPMYSGEDLLVFLKEITAQKSELLFMVDETVYTKYAL